MKKFNPNKNYSATLKAAGYIPKKEASQKDYNRIGFMSGLEVHQQLNTSKKLFCNCPAGLFHKNGEYDAQLIRHMRPTLSELGEYDGTALMEFKTRKEIIYQIKNETTCTYDVDDTPPFPLNREALDISLEISLLSKLNIVGEVHITRKQYLDGSIPAGFQRTAIIGVEGALEVNNKPIRLIQLSLEEDSCREISDIGHVRVYNTDRLGMPLIETVTYPDMVNPEEVKEVCDYIRFLNRSTGKVRTGIGAGRQDVNVSCKGGTRVEIKGVAHTKWIPLLTHIEAFRQWSLLLLRDKMRKKIGDYDNWSISHKKLNYYDFGFTYQPIVEAKDRKEKLIAVNLPGFKGALSHFTQPGKVFGDELSDRLKVIACIEKPNIAHSENLEELVSVKDFEHIAKLFDAKADDAQLLFWSAVDDIETALDVIEERCKMVFDGVPPETRKSFENGTTIFERVLPGADRMYPDTDSAPIPLADEYIERKRSELQSDLVVRYKQMEEWGVPKDTYTYIFRNNLYPIIDSLVTEGGFDPVYVATFLGHHTKWVEGHFTKGEGFSYSVIKGLFNFIKERNLAIDIIRVMLPEVYQYPKMQFDSVLTAVGYKHSSAEEILSQVSYLREIFRKEARNNTSVNESAWIMGKLRYKAMGNILLSSLYSEIHNAKN